MPLSSSIPVFASLPHPSPTHHKGLIKTDWVLGDHTCLWQVRYGARMSRVCSRVCVWCCVDMCLAHQSVSTSCALLLWVQSSPIRSQWEQCVCYSYAFACVCMCVCVWTSALNCAFACDLRRLLHMHFIRVCLLFSEPLKDLTLDVLIRLCRLEPIAASPRLHARLPACHVESRWRGRHIYGLNLRSSSHHHRG